MRETGFARRRANMPFLQTPRLTLVPVTLAIVEAVCADRRDEAEALVGARMPERWPNRELIERAFSVPLEAIRADPVARLWGDCVMVTRSDGARGERGASPEASDLLVENPEASDPLVESPGPPPPRVIGSVVFHGRPGRDGIAEVAYGVEEASQGRGFATEAVRACVAWALSQTGVHAVQAATFPWHIASLRVIEKVGMDRVGVRDHETLGELLVFERRR